MNKIFAIFAAIGLALVLSACNSSVKKPQPYGDWQDANSPAATNQQGGK